LGFAVYRLADGPDSCFLAFRRTRPVHRGESAAVLARDEETGLHDADAFVDLVGRSLGGPSAGAWRMSLLLTRGFDGLRDRLQVGGEAHLLEAIGGCLRSVSLDGDSACRVGHDRFAFTHDAGLDLDGVRQQLVGLARDLDPSREGFEVLAAMVDIDRENLFAAEIGPALAFTINRFRHLDSSSMALDSPAAKLSTRAREAMRAADAFREAVAQGDFDIAFQPILDVNTGTIHHFEALARFADQTGGRSAFEHITFAEGTGLIGDFDLAMAEKVIGWLSRRHRDARPMVAVNISGVSMGSLSYLARLDALLERNSWLRGQLLFEITESARMERLGPANTFIRRLRRHGFPVCLDDFGSGAANFRYLSRLEVDVVKLDGVALTNARKGRAGKAFLKALVSLCRELGIATIAEMVEDEAGLDFVRECGVDYVQGHLFGRPSPGIDMFAEQIPIRLFPSPR
jgi:EAL domain-containing protein (putative c-di-GMP-specific phosphodiesterase class I)